MSLLMMGRDSSDGVLTLDHHGEARVQWRNKPNGPLYRAEMRAAQQVARQLGGRVRFLPTWVFLRTAVTVHNLGVPMGTDATSGTIDADGGVHGYPGLYVMDGAGIPASTGVNPSATIAAVAERRIEALVRSFTGDAQWQAPERAAERPAPVPEDDAMRAAKHWQDVRGNAYDPSPRPVHFREGMAGAVTMTDPDGSIRTERLQLRLAVEVRDGRLRVGRPAPPAPVAGWATLERTRVQVHGTLELFPDTPGTFMRYRLRYTDGRRCRGEASGAKAHGGGRLPRLRDLVTLPVEIDHYQDGARVRGSGVVRISARGLVALALSLRGGGRTAPAAVATLARFAGYFAGTALRRAAAADQRSQR